MSNLIRGVVGRPKIIYRTLDKLLNVIVISRGEAESPELVVQHTHHYPPNVYAIEVEEVYQGYKTVLAPTGSFETIEFTSMKMPVFVKVFNPDKVRPERSWQYYIGEGQYQDYLEHLAAYKLEHKFFVLRAKALVKKDKKLLGNVAGVITEAVLYDREDWANRQTAEANERAVGLSFTSVDEPNFNKRLGRVKSLGRAISEYSLEYLSSKMHEINLEQKETLFS